MAQQDERIIGTRKPRRNIWVTSNSSLHRRGSPLTNYLDSRERRDSGREKRGKIFTNTSVPFYPV